MFPELAGRALVSDQAAEDRDGKMRFAQAAGAEEEDALTAGLERVSTRESASNDCSCSQTRVSRGVAGFEVGERAVQISAWDAGQGQSAFGAELKPAVALVREAVAASIGGDEQAGAVAGGAGNCHNGLEGHSRRKAQQWPEHQYRRV